MEQLGITWFDIAAFAVLGLSGIMGLFRGLIREVFSVVAFIGAVLAAVFLARYASPTVASFSGLSTALATLLAGLLIFLVVFIAVTLLTSAVAKTTHQNTELGSFDRSMGAAYGILRGIVVVAMFVMLLRQTQGSIESPADPIQDAIRGARTYPIYESVAKGLEAVLPRAGARARDILDHQKGESAPIPPAEQTPAEAPAGAPSN